MNEEQENQLAPAGSRLAHARWNPGYRNCEERRRETARALALRRWEKTSPEERASFCLKIRTAKEARRHDRLTMQFVLSELLRAPAL
jgi:RecB family exonuclease